MLQHTELQQIHTALAERIHIDCRWEFQYTCNFIGCRHLRIDHHRQPELLLDKIQLGAVLRRAYTRNRMAVTGLLCDQTAQQIQLIRACHRNKQIRRLDPGLHLRRIARTVSDDTHNVILARKILHHTLPVVNDRNIIIFFTQLKGQCLSHLTESYDNYFHDNSKSSVIHPVLEHTKNYKAYAYSFASFANSGSAFTIFS